MMMHLETQQLPKQIEKRKQWRKCADTFHHLIALICTVSGIHWFTKGFSIFFNKINNLGAIS
jgi:hypothetical protein